MRRLIPRQPADLRGSVLERNGPVVVGGFFIDKAID